MRRGTSPSADDCHPPPFFSAACFLPLETPACLTGPELDCAVSGEVPEVDFGLARTVFDLGNDATFGIGRLLGVSLS